MKHLLGLRYKKCLTLSTNLPQNFLIIRNIQRDQIKNVYRFSSKLLNIMKFESSGQILRKPLMLNFMNFRPVGSELLQKE